MSVTTSRFFVGSLLLAVFSSSLLAAPPVAQSPVITAAAAGAKIRFTSPVATAHIRIQILKMNGDPLFDSAWKDGNVLDWQKETDSQPLDAGSYRCVVMVKDLEGNISQREGTITVWNGELSLVQRGGTDDLTILGSNETDPRITLLAHDGSNGSIVSTSGDLAFRFGNFLAGKDSERMRLTADGNVGIGTNTPQATLDVNGLIRTSKGIMFADGTILTTSAGLAAADGSAPAGRGNPSGPTGLVRALRPPLPSSTTLSPAPSALRPRPNFTPAYQFVVGAGGVQIGATNPAYWLDVAGDVTLYSNLKLPNSSATAGVITLGGLRFAHNYPVNNTFVGGNAGNFTTTGGSNVGVGYNTLFSNANGSQNAVVGVNAMVNNTSGTNNTANGAQSLNSNNTGGSNVAMGYQSMLYNTTGSNNVAIGRLALWSNTSGTANTAIGDGAGGSLTIGNNNIDIGNGGLPGEAATIRIGSGAQSRTFLAGVRGSTTVAADAIPVLIDSNGQLGTASSSRSVKYDIADMGESTDGVMRLRPVTFRYLAHGTNAPLQYGLIAEEVAEVYPELVARKQDGSVETVMYQFLAPMLLNEVQKQEISLEDARRENAALRARLERLEKVVAGLKPETNRAVDSMPAAPTRRTFRSLSTRSNPGVPVPPMTPSSR